MLKDEFLLLRQISQAQLAWSINISLKRVNEICQSKRSINLDTAYRLGLYFNLSAEDTEF
jgi:plasmid maintenance system antidote protein VapI